MITLMCCERNLRGRVVGVLLGLLIVSAPAGASAYQGQVLEAGVPYTVPVNERYWTEFSRTDVLDGPAREMAWSGTAHALVAELGVGAATHSALMLALGIAGLLAGLGVVCTVMGVAFLWHTKRSMGVKIPDTVPEAFVQDKKLETV